MSRQSSIRVRFSEQAWVRENLEQKLANTLTEPLEWNYDFKSTPEQRLTGKYEEDEQISQTIEGKFLGMEGDDFIFITIKDSNGKTQKLFWGASFSGDGELMNAKKLKGKSWKMERRLSLS